MDVQHILASATLTIIVIGCLGNILSLTLFLRHSSSVNVLLAALAFVDLCLLLFAVPVFVVTNLDLWSDDTSGISLTSYLAYILSYVYPINLIFQTCSIYIMCLITIERWIAVHRPLQVSIWCTAKISRRAVLSIFLFSVLYNVPRFFEYSIIYTQTGADYERNLRANPTYILVYYNLCFLATHFVIPFGLILILNCHVINSIFKIRKERLALTRQQIKEQSTTVMLLIVTFIFAFCNTLPFLLNFAECIKPDLFVDEATSNLAYQLNDLSTLLVVLNSSSTWLIYILFSAKYRQTAIRILWRFCMFGSNKDNVYYNSLSRTYSMRASMSLNRKNLSNNCTIVDKSMAKRTDRSLSECNERIQRPASAMMLPKLSKRQSIRSFVSYRSRRKSTKHNNPSTPITNGLLSPPPTDVPQPMEWPTNLDKPDRPLL